MKFLLTIWLVMAAPMAAAQTVQYPEPFAGAIVNEPQLADWRAANERVLEAGGWKAYLRESTQGAAKAAAEKSGAILTLANAIEISLANHVEITQALSGIDVKAPNFMQLSDHQRSALQRHAELIAQIKSAYFAAVAAQERLAYQHQVVEAAAIAAEIASRMASVGNLNAVHQAKEQLPYAQAMQALAKSQTQAMASKEALIRRLNLAGDQAMFSLPDRLPQMPSTPMALGAMDTRAMTEGVAASHFALRHPTAIRVRSEARQAYQQYRAAHDAARHYQQQILPLRKKISEENLLRYNGMLMGVFELLEDAGHQARAVKDYIDRLEAFWVADAALSLHLITAKNQLTQFERSSWK